MGNFSGNGAEGKGVTHRFPSVDHGEAGWTVYRKDMGDARGGSSAGSGGNAVGSYIHRDMSDNRSTVGSVADNIRSARRR